MNFHTPLCVILILAGSAVLKLDQASKEVSSVLMDTDEYKASNCKPGIWAMMY